MAWKKPDYSDTLAVAMEALRHMQQMTHAVEVGGSGGFRTIAMFDCLPAAEAYARNCIEGRPTAATLPYRVRDLAAGKVIPVALLTEA